MRFLFSRPKDQRWCPACGKRANEHGNFCANCGADLRSKEAVTPPESPKALVEVTVEKTELVGPALLPLGSFAKNDREKNAAPFPLCSTTQEILYCQKKARAAGLTIIGWKQRPFVLRAPKPGEEGIIVAESIDDRPKPLKEVFSAEAAATGKRTSRLWIVNDQYPLLGSSAAADRYDAEYTARQGKTRLLPQEGKNVLPKLGHPNDSSRQFAIWRLIAHHEQGERVVRWSSRNGVISVGYGGTGDLHHQRFTNVSELTQIVASHHSNISSGSAVNGGRALWRLFSEMEMGDLVILSTGAGGIGRALSMRVTGDYYYVEKDPEQDYEHRRKAEVIPIDPNRLWELSGGMASGESPRWALIRCANTISQTEYHSLLSGA